MVSRAGSPEPQGSGVSAVAHRVLAPLAYRDFRLLWSGQTISAMGGPLQTVALTWLVLDLTGSAVALSGMLLATALPGAAFTLAGGVITDRYDPRTVMLWSDAARAATTGLIALLALTASLHLWMLYALLAVSGAAGGIFSPAAQSILPRLVPRGRLAAANSLSQSTPQLALLLAAPAGGALVALAGAVPALALNAASYAVAALASVAITPLRREATEASVPLWQSARIGLAYTREHHWLIAIIVLDAFLSFAVIGPLAVGLPLLARERPDMGVAGFGLMLAGFGVGSVVGMLLAGTRSATRRRGIAFCLLELCQGPLAVGLAFAPLSLSIVLLAVMGLLNGGATVMYMALVQGRIATAMLGRVMSFVALGSFGLVPLSQLGAAALAEVAGPRTLFLAAGALLTAAALGGLLNPSLRHLD